MAKKILQNHKIYKSNNSSTLHHKKMSSFKFVMEWENRSNLILDDKTKANNAIEISSSLFCNGCLLAGVIKCRIFFGWNDRWLDERKQHLPSVWPRVNSKQSILLVLLLRGDHIHHHNNNGDATNNRQSTTVCHTMMMAIMMGGWLSSLWWWW